MDQSQPGSSYGRFGPSGSGKTTIIRILTGVYAPDEGQATVLGSQPAAFSVRDREAIGYMPQHFSLYPNLTVWENLAFAASIYGLGFWQRRQLRDQLAFVELHEHVRKLARSLSGGMQRRLSLAAALVHDPQVVFLDEPTAGIDPVLRQKFWERFETLRDKGHTLFITTQYVGEAAFCDYVAVLAKGRILAVETPTELRRSAFGGDRVILRLAAPASAETLAELGSFLEAEIQVETSDNRTITFAVPDGSRAIPRVAQWAQSRDLEIEELDRDHPPFEEIFVRIVRQGMGDE